MLHLSVILPLGKLFLYNRMAQVYTKQYKKQVGVEPPALAVNTWHYSQLQLWQQISIDNL